MDQLVASTAASGPCKVHRPIRTIDQLARHLQWALSIRELIGAMRPYELSTTAAASECRLPDLATAEHDHDVRVRFV